MIAFIGLTVVFVLGVAFLFSIHPKISFLLKVGLAFPAGFGILASLVFLFDLLGIEYNFSSAVISMLLIAVVLVLFRKENWQMYFKEDYRDDLASIKPKSIHLPWMLFFLCLAYVVYGITLKTLYWPTSAFDSITGYDYVAKVTAAEGKLDNSINDPANYTFTLRTLYPPLVPISFAFAYICGLATSKIISSIFFISVLLSFYGFVRYFSTHFNAIVFTLLMAVIPDFLAMSALSLSNVPSVVYSTAGVAFVILYFREKYPGYLLLSTFMLGFAIFTRTEGIVFAAASGLVFLFHAVPQKKWKWIAIYALMPLLYFIAWELYLNFVWELSEFKQPFLYEIIIDSERFSILWDSIMKVTFNTQLYGATLYVILICLLLSVRSIFLRKQSWELLGIVVISWFLYIWVFYQMDIFENNSLMAGGGGYIASGYKRGFFNFLVLGLLFSATTLPVKKTFKKWLG